MMKRLLIDSRGMPTRLNSNFYKAWLYRRFGGHVGRYMAKRGLISPERVMNMVMNMDIDLIMAILAEHIETWGLPTRAARREKRLACSLRALQDFYAAMAPCMPRIIDFLSGFSLDKIPAPYRKLAYATFAMCEVDTPVCKWNSVTPTNYTSDPRLLVPKRSLYDRDDPFDVNIAWKDQVLTADPGEGALVVL